MSDPSKSYQHLYLKAHSPPVSKFVDRVVGIAVKCFPCHFVKPVEHLKNTGRNNMDYYSPIAINNYNFNVAK